VLGHDLDFTVNLLGLHDTSNLLFFSSAEERRVFLKCLWGLVNVSTVWGEEHKKLELSLSASFYRQWLGEGGKVSAADNAATTSAQFSNCW